MYSKQIEPFINKTLFGNVIDKLNELPAESIHCFVTSPPYWGLRDYGNVPQIFCLEIEQETCEHNFIAQEEKKKIIGVSNKSTLRKTEGKKAGENWSKGISNADKIKDEQGFCVKCGAWKGHLGLEPTPELYIKHLVLVCRSVKRVLRKDGVFWINIADTYYGSGNSSGHTSESKNLGRKTFEMGAIPTFSLSMNKKHPVLKPKDLCLIPARLSIALQEDGWWIRNDVIWCLSGGTYLYVKTKKGIGIITIKDLFRLKMGTIELWNGSQWTKLLGLSKSKRTGKEVEIILRSGERIGCTGTHQFPTNRGLLRASELRKGDCLIRTHLPEPAISLDTKVLNNYVAWFVGLYLAEGSRADDTIQISGHKDEISRLDKIRQFASPFGGSVTYTLKGNSLNIRVYGKIINSIIDMFISGKTAKDKCLNPICWKHSNNFLMSILNGYLEGDGHYEEKNNRYRLGFTRNYNLERDIRTLAARLGFYLTLHPKFSKYQGGIKPSFKGEIRFDVSTHFNNKNRNEVMEIRKSRAREFYDIGVEDEPHLFALASGILSHNSKENPMPESMRDRLSRSHEYVFMLTKSRKYYFDQEAIREESKSSFSDIMKMIEQKNRIGGKTLSADDTMYKANMETNIGQKREVGNPFAGRNRRTVWNINTTPYPEAHFAVFPPDLVKIPILASTSEKGCCADCGQPYERILETLGVGNKKENNKDKQYRRRETAHQLCTTDAPNRNSVDMIRGESQTKFDTDNDNAGRLATYGQGLRKHVSAKDDLLDDKNRDGYNSKYFSEYGQTIQGIQRSQSQFKEREISREQALILFPGNEDLQQAYINYVHDHGLIPMRRTIGWKKMCKCETNEIIPCIVGDPFMGSGTTGEEALRLGRSFVGTELNENYNLLQMKRFEPELFKLRQIKFQF